MRIPCKNCITLAICKGKLVADENDENIKIINLYAYAHCSLFRKYVNHFHNQLIPRYRGRFSLKICKELKDIFMGKI